MAVRQAELDREIEVIQRRISDLSARPLPPARLLPPRPREATPLRSSSAACRSGSDSHECGGLAFGILGAD